MDLNKILKEHKLWLENKGGKRANLREANLREADLRETDLREANLREADLREANLREANLERANLERANLERTNLREANLRGTNLRGADLRGTNLRGADLRGADLDFSCWPLWCGSFDTVVNDRIVSQLLYHIKMLNTKKCSTEVHKQLQSIIKNNSNLFNKFKQYRSDIYIKE